MDQYSDFDAAMQFYKNDDYCAAFELFQKSANYGEPRGNYRLGTMYEFGRGVERKYSEAAKCYLKAASQGHAKSHFRLGLMYFNGYHFEKDYAQAKREFEIASKLGEPLGDYMLGYLTQNLSDSADKLNEATYWYERSAKSEHIDSFLQLGAIKLEQDDINSAIHYFRKAAILGNAEGQAYLANLILNNASDDPNDKPALYWATKSAEQGCQEGQKLLGMMYIRGAGVDLNKDKGIYWLTVAAEQGDRDLQCQLASLLTSDRRIIDVEQGIHWYTKSAEAGNSKAASLLAGIYSMGILVDKNPHEAFKWYLIAHFLGDEESEICARVTAENMPNDDAEAAWKEATEWYKNQTSKNTN